MVSDLIGKAGHKLAIRSEAGEHRSLPLTFQLNASKSRGFGRGSHKEKPWEGKP